MTTQLHDRIDQEQRSMGSVVDQPLAESERPNLDAARPTAMGSAQRRLVRGSYVSGLASSDAPAGSYVSGVTPRLDVPTGYVTLDSVSNHVGSYVDAEAR